MTIRVPALPEEIGMLLSHRCTARCRMCCFSSGPEIEQVMSSEDVDRYLDQITAVPSIHTVVFSGGEPFMFMDLLSQAIAGAAERGLRVKVTTNCFWAVSRDKAREVLTRLFDQGLSILEITTDSYHQEFVPVDRVRHGIAVANELGIKVDLAAVVTKGSMSLEDVVNDLGPDLVIERTAEFRCQPMGRARTEVPVDELIIPEELKPVRCQVVQIPAVDPWGVAYLCCGTAGFVKALALGSLHEHELADLLAEAVNDPFVIALAVGGPSRLVDALTGEGIAVPEGPFVDHCHLCNAILRDEELVERLKEVLEEHLLMLMIERGVVEANRSAVPVSRLPFRDG